MEKAGFVHSYIPGLLTFWAWMIDVMQSYSQNTIPFTKFAKKCKNNAKVMLRNSMSSVNRIMGLMHEEEEEKGILLPELKILKGKITFKNVHYGYHSEKPVLKGVQMEIAAGEKFAIVGMSGSGKSTILKLLARLYAPQKGIIEIDGQDIWKCSLDSIRKQIGYVQQECLIFNGAIRYNLLLGNAECSEKEMWEACEKACIADLIRELPQGMDTIIGTGGMDLSGGQKQRLMIARVFLKNPRVLILDEATSALDQHAEKWVHGAIEALKRDRTVIIVAHRLSTILDADKIAVLHEGKIAACGQHTHLIQYCEEYKHLLNSQYALKENIAV